jgi:muconolactone delta-isomerase
MLDDENIRGAAYNERSESMKHFEVTVQGMKPDDFTIGVELGRKAAEHLATRRAKETGHTCHIWRRIKPWKRERIQEVKP